MDVAVKEENLSQAIGRGGQNVRLASQLTGWELNVMNEAQAVEKNESETRDLLNTFKERLGVDEDIASILVQEGFASLDEVAYVPADEMLAIEEFDEELVDELRERAKDALLTTAIAKEETDMSADLLEMEGMDEDLAFELSRRDVKSMEDLAEQSVDELMEIQGMSEQRAAALIMKAREPWFAEEKQE
jgi:N utilization substance protein A